MKALTALILLFASQACWAENFYIVPGGHATIGRHTVWCTDNSDPNPKWGCTCYVLNRPVGGVSVFAPTREKAETAALAKCKKDIMDYTQVVDCQRM